MPDQCKKPFKFLDSWIQGNNDRSSKGYRNGLTQYVPSVRVDTSPLVLHDAMMTRKSQRQVTSPKSTGGCAACKTTSPVRFSSCEGPCLSAEVQV
uniref:Uncharacterized protein n=1 Tax=Heliothis virescens TaxID=7102 RepID=A0A2A4J8Q8_HELVI